MPQDCTEKTLSIMDSIDLNKPEPEYGPTAQNEMIAYVEKLLHMAKLGQLRACCVVAVGYDGDSVSSFITKRGSNKDNMILLAEAQCLVLRVSDKIRFLNNGEI